MKRLDQEVKQMESSILEQTRLKYVRDIPKDVEADMESIVELILEDDSIEEFDQKRKYRKSKLTELSQLYETLKRSNMVEDFLSKKQNYQKMIEKVRQTKEVIDYRVCQEHLVILAKHMENLQENTEK